MKKTKKKRVSLKEAVRQLDIVEQFIGSHIGKKKPTARQIERWMEANNIYPAVMVAASLMFAVDPEHHGFTQWKSDLRKKRVKHK